METMGVQPSDIDNAEALLAAMAENPTANMMHVEPVNTTEHTVTNNDEEKQQPLSESDSSILSDSSDLPETDSEDEYKFPTQHYSIEERDRMLRMMEVDEDTSSSAPPRTKNEIDPPIPPRPQVDISDMTPIASLGKVLRIVGTSVVIWQDVRLERRALDLGSILVLGDQTILGEIYDTFGPVTQPLYTVRFESEQALKETGVTVGADVYYLPKRSEFIATEELQKIKGSDASNIYDEEVSESELEFSDDEKEKEHKLLMKRRQQIAAIRKGREVMKQLRAKAKAEASMSTEPTNTTSTYASPPAFGEDLYVPLERPKEMTQPTASSSNQFTSAPPPPSYWQNNQ
jgi:H/ACA ribonucleoprotein complex non-core subunit NAF1